MFAAEFGYHRAGSAADAVALLKQHPGAKLLAGGHSLIPMLKLRLASPAAVIDIGRIADLKGITVTGGALQIGALTTHAEIARSQEIRRHAPALAEAAAQVADPAVRNRGTIGGNVAHADPASDLPGVLTALGARFAITGPGGARVVAAADFFTGLMATALGEHDLLTAVEVPPAAAGQGSAYVKFTHPASRYAVIGVAAVVGISGGTCTSAAVVLGGLVPSPLRAAAVEKALVGQPPSLDVIASAAAAVAQDLKGEVLGDLFASADYRRATAPVWVKRAISLAASGAR
jgi:carbon-monoxide dehydrogenase medium subunit